MSLSKSAAMALCASAFTLPCWAEKPDWAGKQESKREQAREHDPASYKANQERADKYRRDDAESRQDSRSRYPRAQFGDRHRESVRDYFEPRVRAGRCPPGLAKKDNGCLPPGQAKKWTIGQPLPRELVRYPLPAELLRQLGRPPACYEYARVDNDILLLTQGAALVVDVIENLGGFKR